MVTAPQCGDNAPVKATLIVVASYALSVGLFFAYLIAGAVLGGSSVAGGERAMAFVVVASGVTFLIGNLVVFFGLGRVGATRSVRWTVSVIYTGVMLLTFGALVFIAAIALNR